MRTNFFGDPYYQPGDDIGGETRLVESDEEFYVMAEPSDEDDGPWIAEILGSDTGDALCYLECFESVDAIREFMTAAFPGVSVEER